MKYPGVMDFKLEDEDGQFKFNHAGAVFSCGRVLMYDSGAQKSKREQHFKRSREGGNYNFSASVCGGDVEHLDIVTPS